MELLHYFYNNKKYVIRLNGKGLVFEKENSTEELTEEELIQMEAICNYIIPNREDLIRLADITLDNTYNVFYNKKTALYYFDADNYSTKELELLNCFFNNQSMYLYHYDQDESDSSFKILTRINETIIAIIVSGSILLSSLPIVPNNKALFKIDYHIDSLYKDSIFQKKYEHTIEDIMMAIKTNPNLSGTEKEFLYNIREELEENLEYADLDTIYNNFNELNIVYNPREIKKTKNKKPKATGNYCFLGEDKNVINLFGSMIFPANDFSDCDKSTLIHELQHLVNHRHFLMSSSGTLGEIEKKYFTEMGVRTSVLEELISEKFSREYLDSYGIDYFTIGYKWLMPVMNALCEIVDNDALRKFKFNPDYYFIEDNLQEKGIPLSTIHELFETIEASHYQYLYSEKLTVLVSYKQTNKRLYQIIKECYEATHDNKMEDDLVMLLYFYKSDFVDEAFNNRVRELLNVDNINVVVPKGYFSSNYMTKIPEVLVGTSDEMGEIKDTITITEDDRIIKQNVSRF